MSLITVIGGGMAAASQAQMEAATLNTVGGTPLNTNWHPGVAKAWIIASGDGLTNLASWNVTSITDTAAGNLTVTIATDFSSVNYSRNVSISADEATGLNVMVSNAALNAGAVNISCATSAGIKIDPLYYFLSCFGDQ